MHHPAQSTLSRLQKISSSTASEHVEGQRDSLATSPVHLLQQKERPKDQTTSVSNTSAAQPQQQRPRLFYKLPDIHYPIKRQKLIPTGVVMTLRRMSDKAATKAPVSVGWFGSQHANTKEYDGEAEEPQPRRKLARWGESNWEKGRLRQKDDDEDMREQEEDQELPWRRNGRVAWKASRDSHGSAGEGMNIQQIHLLPRGLRGSGMDRFAHAHHLAHTGWGDGASMAASHAGEVCPPSITPEEDAQ
ncbi:hypothetical protein AZE42_09478, partial [Rhizopogon vesiculosus]